MPSSPASNTIGNYQYDSIDHDFLRDRITQFRHQINRRLSGELTEDEFKPLRLMNGLYLQIHAYMLRVAIPYGILNSRQMRILAKVAHDYDKGYGHLSTRQNIQFNWIKLENVADILELLAQENLHAIQTSGNCIRNVTSDHFAGAASDEIVDPRIHAEIIRQWSTLHPEFTFLPRKFKISITGSSQDRVCAHFHDIGIMMRLNENNEPVFKIYVGGGLGRTPIVGKLIRDNLPQSELIAYLEAILHVYNVYGRRDNKFKARIKILVQHLGIEKFRQKVETFYNQMDHEKYRLTNDMVQEIQNHFNKPTLTSSKDAEQILERDIQKDEDFSRWVQHNVTSHFHEGYACMTISCKSKKQAPGDLTSHQMNGIAELSERFSFGEIRISHRQNIVFGHVRKDDLYSLFKELHQYDLHTANISMITDMITCPGLDYCSLANARSLPIAKELTDYFQDNNLEDKIGPLQLNISGCINACGHHHTSAIGVLGVDKHGHEAYQITLGGQEGEKSQIGKIIGPALSREELLSSLKKIVNYYLLHRNEKENFSQNLQRIGLDKFKEIAYAHS